MIDFLKAELPARILQARRAADLLRSAADRIEAVAPAELLPDLSARLRGASVLAHTAALELAALSGWLEALSTAD